MEASRHLNPLPHLLHSHAKKGETSEARRDSQPARFRLADGGIFLFQEDGGEAAPKSSAPDDYLLTIYPHSDRAQVEALAEQWDLHPLLVENMLHPMQGKFGQYEDVLYLPLRGARYTDATGDVRLIPLQLLLRGSEAALLLPQGEWLDGEPLWTTPPTSGAGLFRRVGEPTLLQEAAPAGPPGFAYWLVDEVVASFMPTLEGLEEDQEQIEDEVFSGSGRPSKKIYKLNQEAAELLRATNAISRGLPPLIDGLYHNYPDSDMNSYFYFGDLGQHVQSLNTQVTLLRESLTQVLTVNATLVAERQNDDMKKISGWAGVLFAPTLVAGIYGMNFERMPELGWGHGYPAALLVMIAFSFALYTIFKKNDWI